MGKMTVYHGSHTTVRHPQILRGKNTKDFGTGFCCSTHQICFCSDNALDCLEYVSSGGIR